MLTKYFWEQWYCKSQAIRIWNVSCYFGENQTPPQNQKSSSFPPSQTPDQPPPSPPLATWPWSGQAITPITPEARKGQWRRRRWWKMLLLLLLQQVKNFNNTGDQPQWRLQARPDCAAGDNVELNQKMAKDLPSGLRKLFRSCCIANGLLVILIFIPFLHNLSNPKWRRHPSKSSHYLFSTALLTWFNFNIAKTIILVQNYIWLL